MFDMYPYIMASYGLYFCIFHATAYMRFPSKEGIPSYVSELGDEDEIGD